MLHTFTQEEKSLQNPLLRSEGNIIFRLSLAVNDINLGGVLGTPTVLHNYIGVGTILINLFTWFC